MNNEALIQFWNKSKKHLNMIAVLAFIAMTSCVGYYRIRETSAAAPPAVTQPPTWSPQPLIDSDPAKTNFLATFAKPAPAFDDTVPEYVVVVQNPWELRDATSQDEINQRAVKQYNDAKAAFQTGNLDLAERLATQAAVNKPNYPDNDKLLEEIAKARVAAAAPKP